MIGRLLTGAPKLEEESMFGDCKKILGKLGDAPADEVNKPAKLPGLIKAAALGAPGSVAFKTAQESLSSSYDPSSPSIFTPEDVPNDAWFENPHHVPRRLVI